MDHKRSAEATTIIATTKRKKQGDRVVVDVGGQQYMTSRSTLIAGSDYFSTLFSESWTHEDDENDENDENGACSCFLDQNPTAFGILLDFMREGMVQVNDLANVKVLALAEYLGMADLIFTIKVATYLNLHPTFSGTEDEAQQAFDTTYGSSLKPAITSGLLPKALQEQLEARGTDYATMKMAPWGLGFDTVTITAPEFESTPEPNNQFPILGGLNWLHYHGYTILGGKMQRTLYNGDELTFSRLSNTELLQLPCTHVLIGYRPKPPTKKNFALLLSTSNLDSILFYAPHGGREGPIVPDVDVISETHNSRWCILDRMSVTMSSSPLKFLQDHRYVYREEALEAEFKGNLDDTMECYFRFKPENLDFQIYSRVLDEEEGVAMS